MKAIRFFNDGSFGYVCETKKRLANGKFSDWGYTSKSDQAIELSQYWIKIFESDMKFCSNKYQLV